MEELDWQGDVPPSWLRLGPVPGCPAPPPLPPPSPSWLEWDEAAVLLIPPALFAVCGVALRLLRPGVADKPRGGSQGVRMARAMSTTVRAARYDGKAAPRLERESLISDGEAIM